MKIIKFKKTIKGKYKVYLENGDAISLFEDVIIDNNLLLTKQIDDEQMNDLINQNNDIYIYGMALRFISIRMRSIKEVIEYLIKKEVSSILIEKTIDRLQKEGLLNDFDFAKAYIHDQLIITNRGPFNIRRELANYGINEDILDEVMEDIDTEVVKEKLSNLMQKQLRIKTGSQNLLKIKIINYFNNLGYDNEMILNELSKYNLKSDINKLEKDYNKLYNKYKGKYETNELRYFISQKLYSKGYTSDDIKKVLK